MPYKKRWHIESFYKVLKTAYKADQIYLHSSREAIENLLTIINIAAFRTYWVIHQARQNPNEKAIHYFKKQEIIAIDIYTMRQKRNKPNKTKTLKDMYYKIATLGGYKNTRNTHPPGILTIYRGLQKLQNITEMYNAMTIEKYVTKT